MKHYPDLVAMIRASLIGLALLFFIFLSLDSVRLRVESGYRVSELETKITALQCKLEYLSELCIVLEPAKADGADVFRGVTHTTR